MKIFPAWNPSSGDHSSGGRNASKQPQESLNLSSNSWHRDVSGCPSKSKGHQGVVSDFNVETQVGAQSEKGELYVNSHGTSHHVTFASPLHLALVDDGKSQGSVVSRVMDENACIKIENSFVCFDDHINDGFTKSCSTNISEMDFRYLFHDKWTTSRENSIDVPECVPSNEYGKDSEITYSDIDRISRGMRTLDDERGGTGKLQEEMDDKDKVGRQLSESGRVVSFLQISEFASQINDSDEG
ncbi:hypothetical protein T459_25139 [Capsicum annuum]|uniref:Uncharacterized protein n=1 Tax=Capsicum annuum TaxID=4072 RepID=A0A2G2YK00_CAPAN|nr:hypothetical protein T459_25139 [Capsicum annuum]